MLLTIEVFVDSYLIPSIYPYYKIFKLCSKKYHFECSNIFLSNCCLLFCQDKATMALFLNKSAALGSSIYKLHLNLKLLYFLKKKQQQFSHYLINNNHDLPNNRKTYLQIDHDFTTFSTWFYQKKYHFHIFASRKYTPYRYFNSHDYTYAMHYIL